MANYFPHPSNMRQQSGCVSLLIEEGPAGYGVYCMILEVLRDAPGYAYNPDPKVWAYLLHCQDTELLHRVLKNYSLFDIDDNGLLYSPWLVGQMNSYDETKKRRSLAGKKGANKRWASPSEEDGNAMAMPSEEDGNAMAIIPNITNSKVYNNTIPTEEAEKDRRYVCSNQGRKMTEEDIHMFSQTAPSGYNTGYLAQLCLHYGMGENVFNFLCKHTDNANLDNSAYKYLCSEIKRIEREKWRPNDPAKFFTSRVLMQ